MFKVTHAGQTISEHATEADAVRAMVKYAGALRRGGAKVSREWMTSYKVRLSGSVQFVKVKAA